MNLQFHLSIMAALWLSTLFSFVMADDIMSFLRGRASRSEQRDLATCSWTQNNCANDQVVDYGPLDCDPSGLSLVELSSFTHTENGNTDTLISLMGPSNPSDAAAIVLMTAHGGYDEPDYIPDRSTNDPQYCDPTCKTFRDSYTQEIALEIAEQVRLNYCKVPYVVINYLHRKKLDANRDVGEAAQGNAIAEGAWEAFHNFTSDAQQLVLNQFGTTTTQSNVEGIHGILLDVHGYSGRDWVSTDGSPLIQWGYRLTTDTLDPNQYCPMDVRPWYIGSFSHARELNQESLECLVRGPRSIGQRFADKTPLTYAPSNMCGKGVPSWDYPDPGAMETDPAWCEDWANDNDPCHYYIGGYDVKHHEFLDWRTESGPHMNAVQAEFPRCLRFGSGYSNRQDLHPEMAEAVAVVICSFLKDLFPNVDTCG